jgi:hypothetical protein
VNDECLMQVRDMPAFIKEHRGVNIAVSTLQKYSMRNVGPRVDAKWNRRNYSKPSSVLDWVDNVLLRSSEERLLPNLHERRKP